MAQCCVPCCFNGSESKKTTQLSLNRIPCNKKEKRKWLQLIRNFKDDLQFLLQGVSEFDIQGEPVPSDILVHGPSAFPIGFTPDGRTFCAGALYGQGRVIVASHESYLGRESLSTFMVNAIHWLDQRRNGVIGIEYELESVSCLLSKSGLQCRITGLQKDLSVFVCTSYSDAQCEEIQDFVAAGGGLLIGGHAWWWAYCNPGRNVMTDCPGNRILGRMGICLSDTTVDQGLYKAPQVSRYALEFLLQGVSEFDIKCDAVASQILVQSPSAFPIGSTPDGKAFLAGGYYGQGRVIVASHESYLGRESLSTFMVNAIHWLDQRRNGVIGVLPELKSICSLLSKSGLQCRITGIQKDLSVFVCTSYSDAQCKEIQDFVAAGGGLLIGGHAWWWAHCNPGRNVKTDCPGNRILGRMGICLSDTTVEQGLYKAPQVFKYALEFLLQGVSEFDIDCDAVASQVLVQSPSACPIGSTPEGKGRLPWSKTDCPGNRILDKMGICLSDKTVKAGKYKALEVNQDVLTSSGLYHFQDMLQRFSAHVLQDQKLGEYELQFLKKFGRDCISYLRMQAHDSDMYKSVVNRLKDLVKAGFPQVSPECPVKSPKDRLLLLVGTELFRVCRFPSAPLLYKTVDAPNLPSVSNARVRISITTSDEEEWISTGLYLSPGMMTNITVPRTITGKGWQVQIGCQTDDLSDADELKRAPNVCERFRLEKDSVEVFNLWGGLIYLIAPPRSSVQDVEVVVQTAIKAPYYKSGETSVSDWVSQIREAPAPWAELEFENLIMTMPSDVIRHLDHPDHVATVWNSIMRSVAEFTAKPAGFPRKERFVADIQISVGFMHSGYPIMMHTVSAPDLVNPYVSDKSDFCGPVHVLLINQKLSLWEFPPDTTEYTRILWFVYMLGVKKTCAHDQMNPQRRQNRIKKYIEGGRNLKDWTDLTDLETYMQLQEQFGWDELKKVFAAYHDMTDIPQDNEGKMNLYAETFSKVVNRNLTSFFKSWGWPIQPSTEEQLCSLPEWKDHPLVQNFKDDLQFLLQGVSEFDIQGEPVPSDILVHGPSAFPIGFTPDGQTFCAGALYGQGRVIVASHESYLGRESLSTFMVNAIHWLDQRRNGVIGIEYELKSVSCLLSKSGLQCRITGLQKDLSVFVCNSYSDAQCEEIQDFVAAGGGLLIGGHAWWWAYCNPGCNVMTDCPGNRILGRMGICLSDKTVDQGMYKAPQVSRYALEFLLQGVSEFDIKCDAVASQILVQSPSAFPIGSTPDGKAFLAGGYYGQGRVIVASHESYLGRESLSTFMVNAIHWLDQRRNGVIGVLPELKSICSLLSKSGLQCRITGIQKDLSVFVCTSYSDAQCEEIQDFVAAGGGLLIGGHACRWAHCNHGRNVKTDCPGNRILGRMGICLSDTTVEQGLYKAPQVFKYALEFLLQGVSEFDIDCDAVASQVLVQSPSACPIGCTPEGKGRLPWSKTDCPGNRILDKMGICLSDKTVEAGKYKAPEVNQDVLTSSGLYHFQDMLQRFSAHVLQDQKLGEYELQFLKKFGRDCISYLRMQAHDSDMYKSVVNRLKDLVKAGFPQVSPECPVKSPKDRLLLLVGTELFRVCRFPSAPLLYKTVDAPNLPSVSNARVRISITTSDEEEWISTGLYLSPGMMTNITVPRTITGKGWQVQIGCQTDDSSGADELKRAPNVCERFRLEKDSVEVFNLWGGLIYLIAPPRSSVQDVEVVVQTAIKAPYYKSGETSVSDWVSQIREAPAPWAELEFENLIMTMPSDVIRHLDHPDHVATVWNSIMRSVADFAAKPAGFPRKERFVTDVQIPAGFMHSGYPIMMPTVFAPDLVNPYVSGKNNLCGPVHVLLINQKLSLWEFLPNTTEYTLILWFVYMLGVKKICAHDQMTPQRRQNRIKKYIEGGRNLKDWTDMTALETYMQLQEQFGWDEFKKVFAAYHDMTEVPQDNEGKMNLYVETFSKVVNRNLTSFFKAWGWAIQPSTEEQLCSLPEWKDHPLVQYG